MPPQTPNPISPEDRLQRNHNKPLFFAALLISLAILVFAIWYGSDKENQSIKEAETLDIIADSITTHAAETSKWKTYRNEEYGFELEYPGDLSISVSEEMFADDYIRISSPLSQVSFQIYGYKKVYEDLDSWLKNNIAINSPGVVTSFGYEVKNTNVDGINSKEIYTCAEGGYIETFLLAKNYSLELRTVGQCWYKEVEPVYRQILSTFKFIATSTATTAPN